MQRRNISAVMPIIVANIALFVLQLVLGEGFTSSLVLSRGDLFIRPWTLVTSMFLHGSAAHIFFNMYALMIFGPLLEQKIGAKRFLMAYFGTGILASLVSQSIYPAALGASGAIMGIIGIIIILMPNLPILFFFFIPMPLWVAGIFIAALDILGAVGIGFSGVANFAHLAGLAGGIAIGLTLMKTKRKFDRKFEKKTDMDESDIEEYLREGRI